MDFRDDTEPADLLNSRHGVEEISDPACRLLNRPPGYLTFCLYAWPVVFPGTWLRYFAQEDVVSHDTAIVSFLHLQTNLSAILPRRHVLLFGLRFRAITSCLLELAVVLTCVVRSQVFRSSSSHALCSTQIRPQPLPTTNTFPAPLRPNKARFIFHPPKTKSPSHPYPSYFATSQHTSAFWLNHKKKAKVFTIPMVDNHQRDASHCLLHAAELLTQPRRCFVIIEIIKLRLQHREQPWGVIPSKWLLGPGIEPWTSTRNGEFVDLSD
jgi:hypothetical protein